MDLQPTSMFVDIATLTITIAAIPLLMVYRLVGAEWLERTSELSRSYANGTAFGIAAIAIMLSPVDISAEGSLIDARETFIVLASVFGGRWSSLIAAFYVIAFRLFLGGEGMEVAFINALVVGALGVFFSLWFQPQRDFRSLLILLAMGASLVAAQFPIMVFSGLASLENLDWLQFGIVILAMYIITTILVAELILLADREHRLRRDLLNQETRVRESEERYERAVTGTNDGLWDWEIPNNQMYFSPRFTEILGYEQRELAPVAETVTDLTHPDDKKLLATAILAHIDQDVPYDFESRLRHKNGEYIWVRSKARVFRDEDGNPFRMAGSMTDISERKLAEEQLRQAQKMEAVGQLTGGVAHDFNNLLTVVLGNVEMARERLGENERVQPLLERVFQAGKRGADLTQRLLAYSRQQILAPAVIDLNEILENTSGLLERTLGEHIEITSTLGTDLWRCLADRSQIENAILNFALNARDAMPEGGRLSLETANAPLDDEYAAAQAEVEPGEYVMLAVTDTGQGISPEHQEHIFEPFFTTKKVGEGSGLGLSTIYGFVKQSGGHVTVYSEVGEGTTFKIYLPRTQKALAERSSSKAAKDDHAVREATILVVEDDPDVRTLAVALLSDMGYQVIEARSGPAALSLLKQGQHVDLLLSDIVMPGGMNGPELADAIRKDRPGTRVLFMSGYTEKALADTNRLEGIKTFLQKPFRKKDLADKVREVLTT